MHALRRSVLFGRVHPVRSADASATQEADVTHSGGVKRALNCTEALAWVGESDEWIRLSLTGR